MFYKRLYLIAFIVAYVLLICAVVGIVYQTDKLTSSQAWTDRLLEEDKMIGDTLIDMASKNEITLNDKAINLLQQLRDY